MNDSAVPWRRIAQVMPGPAPASWAVSHAALPVVQPSGRGRLRVHFSARDAGNRSRIGTIEVDPAVWAPIDREPAALVLDIGRPGTFDDHGVTSSWIVEHDGREFHYYTGWTLSPTVPFLFFAGLAIRETGADCARRVSEAPILGRSTIDPFLTASPCVLIDNGVWRMWYVSGVGWRSAVDPPQPLYHIKYAESRDGIAWRRAGVVCIDFAGPAEHAIARPCVIKEDGRYRMWFCSRGRAYRIGYAESADGLVWERDDARGGLLPAAEGWDSEMVAYPFVVDHGGERLLFYNGNGYGRSGFGVAAWNGAGR